MQKATKIMAREERKNKEIEKVEKSKKLMEMKKRIGYVLKGIQNNWITRPNPTPLYDNMQKSKEKSWAPLLIKDEVYQKNPTLYDDQTKSEALFSSIKRKWDLEKSRQMISTGPIMAVKEKVVFF